MCGRRCKWRSEHVVESSILSTQLKTATLVVAAFSGLLLTPRLSARARTSCPSDMVDIEGAYCIDAFEAHLVLDGGGTHPFYRAPKGLEGYRAQNHRGAYPQAHISREQANAACLAAGKRLCTSDEWEKACRGPEPTTYPYGVKHREGYCNDQGVAPLPILFGYDRVQYNAGTMNDPRLNRVPGTLVPAGRFGRCTNGYGIYDLVGNLHEWIADPSGVLRGGYYLDSDDLGEGCAYRAIGHAPEYRDYSTGFRCCANRPGP